MDINKLIKKVQTEDLSDKELESAIKVAKKAKNAELAYELACVIDASQRKEMEQVVLESKDTKMGYFYAKDIPGANLKAFEKMILDEKDVEYACEYACDIPSANVQKLQKLVIDSNDPKYAYIFARDVANADIVTLGNIVANRSKDASLVKKFAEDVEGADKRKLNLALARLARAKRFKADDELVK